MSCSTQLAPGRRLRKVSYAPAIQPSVSTVFGTRSIWLGVLSIVAFPVLFIGVMYTPIAILGLEEHVGVVCALTILMAGAGFALGVICWREASSSPVGTGMRAVALARGRVGAVLCGLLILAYVVLWFWLPTVAY